MNRWTEYCGYLRNGDSLDKPSSSSAAAAAAAVSMVASSCINERSASAHHIGTLGRSETHLRRKPTNGLKKCFHCPHCRYSTDRKNNLKRHLGTMHRDHYGTLDQSGYRVSLQKRAGSGQSFTELRQGLEDFPHKSFNKRHVATVLLDDFARTDDVSTAQINDVTNEGVSRNLPLLIVADGPKPSSITARSSDISIPGIGPPSTAHRDDVSDVVAASSTTARTAYVTIHQAIQNGDVSKHGAQLSPVIIDNRNSLPRFEPRPGAAYCRRSSRMFFYDRLRCTHADHHITDDSD